MGSASDYYRKLSDLENNVPTYQSQYGDKISELLDKITNRKDFTYDFNADPLYQAYKDNYVKLGNEAAMNAVANASAMTGGYANSYAATAGAQANQQYLTQLNNVIPSLYDAAQSKYKMDTDNLKSQYAYYQDAEDAAYQKYRDAMADYNNQLAYYRGAYNSAASQEAAQAAAAQAASGSPSPVPTVPTTTTNNANTGLTGKGDEVVKVSMGGNVVSGLSAQKQADINAALERNASKAQNAADTKSQVSQYSTAVEQVKERSGSTAQAKQVAVDLYNNGTINENAYKKLLTVAYNS